MEEKTYRVTIILRHSFTVTAENEERAHEIASYEVLWDDHIADCDVQIEEE